MNGQFALITTNRRAYLRYSHSSNN